MKIHFIYLVICLGTTHLFSQDAAIWNQYVDAKANGTEPILPDFSYAGYDYSETPLPDISDWPVFDVTDYGAVPDDGQYDDAQVQATINAAEANGEGVVYFPAGRFLFSPSNYINTITISGSNIVLKGAGAGPGETELFVEEMNVQNWKFEFKPIGGTYGIKGTAIVAQAQRESFEIEVADAAGLSEGQQIIIRTKNASAFSLDYFAPRELLPEWTQINSNFFLSEIHTIESINGNMITFREPLHISIKPSLGEFYIYTYNHTSENGIEDIRFTGGWLNYPETFAHHRDDIHDYGWQAVRMRNVSNGWVKDCVFHSWNRAFSLNLCSKTTIVNTEFTGKKGHFGPAAVSSYGSLFKNCEDNTGNHHGPSVSNYSSGTVYQHYQMNGDQRVDSHGSMPYATLYDNVIDGYMHDNGAATRNLPNHGRHFVFWNFKLDGGPEDYDFWLPEMPGNTGRHFYADPIFVGLHGDPVNLLNTGVNESQGTPVTPTSLFDAQLACRLNAEDFDGDGVIDTRDLDDDNDGILDSIEGTSDFDQDGIPNNKDLDSDNDSCVDAIEGEGNFDYTDLNDIGAIQGAVNGSGIPIEGQQALGSARNSNTIACCNILDFDHDNDGVSDVCDLDNDNDGITDTDEMTCELNTEFTFLGLSNQNKVAQWSVSNGFYSGIFTAVTDHPEGSWLNQKTSSTNYVRIKFAEASQKIFVYYSGDKIVDDISITLSSIGSGTKLKFWGQNEVINNDGGFGLNTLTNTLSVGDIFSANQGHEIRDNNNGELIFRPYDFNIAGQLIEININEDTEFTGIAEYNFMLLPFCDTDNDDFPNHLDTDSDEDDCADAIEGSKAYLPDHLVGGMSLCADSNCVNARGVPQVADSNGSVGPQSIGSSQDSQTQPDMDNDGISDCMDTCPNVEFNLFSFEDGAIHYETDGEIQSAQVIGPGGDVEYDSGTSILLFPSFTVLSGAQFHAYIEGCDN